jgi:TPR repeat protein
MILPPVVCCVPSVSSFAEAEKWIRLAANQGVPAAQLALGLMYINQEGVPQDDVNAHMWLNLAAARGIRDAIELRDKIAELMTPEQIAHVQHLARDWKPKR